MLDDDEKIELIRIHVDGRTTDYGLVSYNADLYPLAFKQAQKLLKAVEKFIKRKGFFTNDEKRFLNVETELSGMFHALRREGYGTEKPLAGFSRFMNKISDTFPNWQPEYTALNEIFLAPAIEEQELEIENEEQVDEPSYSSAGVTDLSEDWVQFYGGLSMMTTDVLEDLKSYINSRSEQDFKDGGNFLASSSMAIVAFFMLITCPDEDHQKYLNLYCNYIRTSFKHKLSLREQEEELLMNTYQHFSNIMVEIFNKQDLDDEKVLQKFFERCLQRIYCICLREDYSVYESENRLAIPFNAFDVAYATRMNELLKMFRATVAPYIINLRNQPVEYPYPNVQIPLDDHDQEEHRLAEEDEVGFVDGFDGNALMDWALFSKQMSDLTNLLIDDLGQYVRDRSGKAFVDEYHFMAAGAVSIMAGFLWVLSDREQEEKIRHINIYRDTTMALLKSRNGWGETQAEQVLENSDGFTRFLMDDIACFNTMSDSSLQDLVRSQIRMLYCECQGINYHDAMFNLNLLPESDADLRHTLFAMGLYGQVRNEIAPMMKNML